MSGDCVPARAAYLIVDHIDSQGMVFCFQMLLQSKLVRSQSSFQLLEHFIQEGIIGRSRHSEVMYQKHLMLC